MLPLVLATCQTELLEVTQIFHLELRHYFQTMAESSRAEVSECSAWQMFEVS